MLNFNQKSRPPERSLPDLNTSHIKLQPDVEAGNLDLIII